MEGWDCMILEQGGWLFMAKSAGQLVLQPESLLEHLVSEKCNFHGICMLGGTEFLQFGEINL